MRLPAFAFFGKLDILWLGYVKLILKKCVLQTQIVYWEGSEGVQRATARPPDGLRPLVASKGAKPLLKKQTSSSKRDSQKATTQLQSLDQSPKCFSSSAIVSIGALFSSRVTTKKPLFINES